MRTRALDHFKRRTLCRSGGQDIYAKQQDLGWPLVDFPPGRLASMPLFVACFLSGACADSHPRQSNENRIAHTGERANKGTSLSNRENSAETTGSTTRLPAGMKALDSLQLKELITGRTLSIKISSMKRPLRRRESFRENGELLVHLDRVTVRARYTTTGNQLCSFVPGEPDVCRVIYRFSDGKYFINDPPNKGTLDQLIIE